MKTFRQATLVMLAAALAAAAVAAPAVDDSPAEPAQWGFRPFEGSTVEVNPPPFVWRPQKGAETYYLECSPSADFATGVYRSAGHWMNCHCPPKPFAPGRYYWRFGYADGKGQRSSWSQVRSFVVPEGAVEFPLPPLEELLARVPTEHPRLFLRPEEVDTIRQEIEGSLREPWERLVRQADRLVATPPPTEEPLRYEESWKHGEPRWLERWWGNREKTIAVVDGAATLAFVYRIGGEKRYGDAARTLMLAAAAWDPKGATGYRYNDEAGMPPVYLLSRAYTWGYDALSEADRETIRAAMAVRAGEVFDHLRRVPHTWLPYGSHRNRAWHKLGEAAIAFLGEIEDAPKWLEHTVNTFYCCYPVWSDADGGWHEGTGYWSSYIGRQTWWLDVMKSALRIDGYERPYFRRAGYFPLYVMPPGTQCGGFGDSALERGPGGCGRTVSILAKGAQNGHWQWYAEAVGSGGGESGYLGFLRARQPAPKPQKPDDLPPSAVFRGTGLAMLHTNLLDATKDVEVCFKSSPMGTQSHGFNAQNSFVLAVHGKPVLIWTGKRDWHGSPHHTQWMWETKAQNSILVNGEGQQTRTYRTDCRIEAFHTSRDFDYVVGEAADAYEGRLKRFTRTILFAKPDVIVIYDQLEAHKPSTYTYLLHAPEKMQFADPSSILASNGDSRARVSILEPRPLRLDQHNRFEPRPQKWPDYHEWHFSAETPDRHETVAFVTVIRPYAGASEPAERETIRKVEGGRLCEIAVKDGGMLRVLLRDAEATEVRGAADFRGDAHCAAVRLDSSHSVVSVFSGGGGTIVGEPSGKVYERTDRPLAVP